MRRWRARTWEKGEEEGRLSGFEALEELLPIRGSISKFYNGKSKSFAFLKEAMTSSDSTRDIYKAENACTRKRKNLDVYSILYGHLHKTAAEVYQTVPPKRPASLSINSLLTLASCSSRSSSSISFGDNDLPEKLQSSLSPASFDHFTPPNIPAPQPGSGKPRTSSVPMRSLSMMDFHRIDA